MNQVISHKSHPQTFEENYESIKDRILQKEDQNEASIKEQLTLLNELSKFPLGQFMIQNRGLNGFWTTYFLRHPEKGRVTQLNSEGQPFSKLETFLLDQAPLVLAAQERYKIVLQELQKRACLSNQVFASVPCGTLDDLMHLNFKETQNLQIYGVDLDQDVLQSIEADIEKHPLKSKIRLLHQDAWEFDLPEKASCIVSNGLNVYVESEKRLIDLYRHFYDQLKERGELIMSFITPGPQEDKACEWKLSQEMKTNLLKQKVIFSDLLQAQWQYFRSTKDTEQQLVEAGFKQVTFLYEASCMFPVAIAKK